MSATPSATPTPTPSPSATPPTTALDVAVSPNALSFLSLSSQTVDVQQDGGNQVFTATTPAQGQPNSCSGIAAASATQPSGTYDVVAQGSGHCAYTFTGASGMSATLTIDVTISTVGGS